MNIEAKSWVLTISLFNKRDVLKHFAKFRGKHLCQNLFFNKVANLRIATLVKKRLWHRCFSKKICEMFKNVFFTEHLRMTASGHSCVAALRSRKLITFLANHTRKQQLV